MAPKSSKKSKKSPLAAKGLPNVSKKPSTWGSADTITPESPKPATASRPLVRFAKSAAIAFVLAAVSAFGYLQFREFTAVPSVSGANFSLEYRKIPFNVPSVDFTFSTDLDPASITAESVKVSPALLGVPVLKDANVVSFALTEKMKIGEKYAFSLSADIASKRGKKMDREATFEVEAVAGVKVSRAIPTGETENLSKNPIFIFNIPVVALASLSTKDALPCPVRFEPAVAGKCSWISGNVLEYQLEKSLPSSTEFRFAVGSEGLSYPMAEVFTGSFSTPRLSVLSPLEASSFSPKDGIELRFSAEVAKADLEKSLSLQKKSSSGAVEFRLEPKNGSDAANTFVVTGKDGPLDHSTQYALTLSPGLKPAYGNLSMLSGATLESRSADFLANVVVRYAVFSETGTLTDTWDVPNEGAAIPILPTQNAKLAIDFDEDVDFVKGSVRIVGGSGETLSECDLSPYERKVWANTATGTAETSLTSLSCDVKTELPPNSAVRLVISKAVSKSLKTDVAKDFVTAPTPAFSDFKLLSATEACLYSNVPIPNDPAFLQITPSAKVREIMPDGRYEWINGDNREVFSCPKISGKRAFVASTRLIPKTSYAFAVSALARDAYGSRIKSSVNLGTFVAPDVSDKDRYLYSNALREVNVIPSDVPIVVGMRSVNIDSAIVGACETDEAEYFRFVANSWRPNYQPNCSDAKQVSLPLQNRHWELSPKQLDVEADVLGRKFQSNFVIVRGSARDHYNLAEGGYRDSDREFFNFYVRSNLAVTVEKGAERAYVFATSYDGKEAPSDLKFRFFGFDTDSENLVPLNIKIAFDAKRSAYSYTVPKGQIALLTASNDRYFGIVSMNTDEASNYDFGYVSGSDSSSKDYAYIYSDRPIYRAGDSVFVKGIVRRFQPTWYEKAAYKEVKVRVLDQDSELFKEFPAKLDASSNFHFDFALPKETKPGRYSFEAYVMDPKGAFNGAYVVTDAYFFVEAYSKPVFKTVLLDEGRKDVLPGEKIEVPFENEYYFGGKLANAPYRVSVHSQSYYFDPKDFSAYRFGTDSGLFDCVYWGYCRQNDELVATFDGKTDGNGRGVLRYEFPKSDSASSGDMSDSASDNASTDVEKLVSFSIESTDPDTKKTVTQTLTKAVHRTDAYVGIRAPYWVDKNSPMKSEGVVLDWNAKPLSGKAVKTRFVRREWKEVKKLGIDGAYYAENELLETVEKELSATSDSEGKFRVEYLPSTGGEFEIRSSYVGKNGASYESSAYSFVSTDSYVAWNSTNNSVAELTAEKTVLKPGETAVFTLKSPVKSGKLFVTVEKDDAILDVFSRDITSYGEKIEIPLDSRHIPNVYVKVYLIGKEGNSPLPTYKRALSVVKVLPDEKRLSVEVKTDKSRYLPWEVPSVTVFVRDALGNPVANANGSLSVVDESVLALMGNPKKNPFAFFYEMKRYLGVTTALSLSYLVDRLEVKSGALGQGAKGGAWEDRKGGDAKKKRGIFKDTAFWRADFTTDKNGKSTIAAEKLPDNLTTWEIEALVSTSPNTKIGVGSTSVVTAKEVMLNENLPRALRSGDAAVLAPVVFNRTSKDSEFEVSIISDALEVSKPSKKTFVKSGESKAVAFGVKVKDVPPWEASAYAKITVSAKAVPKDGSNDAQDTVEKTLVVTRSETLESVATVGSTDAASFDERLDFSGIDKSRANLTVRYGASLFGTATDGLEALLRYPYGCVEQKTSAVIPYVLTKQLSDAVGAPFDLDGVKVPYYSGRDDGVKEKSVREVLTDYVVGLGSFRRTDGGFGYWQGSEVSDFRMTAHVLQTVSEIRSFAIVVEPSLLSDATAYLKREFYSNRRPYCFSKIAAECQYSTLDRLSAISAVLAANPTDYEAYKMFKLLDRAKFAPSEKTAELAVLATLKRLPKLAPADVAFLTDTAKADVDALLKASLVYDSRGAYLAANGNASRTELTAMFVSGVSLLGLDSGDLSGILDNASRFIARQKKSDGSYGSTLETAAALRAFANRAKGLSTAETNFVAKGSLNSEQLFETAVSEADALKTFEKRVDVSTAPDASVMNFVKTGNGRLFYDLSLSYPVAAETISARDEGFFVQTQYYDLGDYRRIEALKNEEYARYLAGDVAYAALKYPKDAYSYLEPISGFSVGKLVLVRYRLILAEDRDRVAFESFVPSGSEIVNTNLSTESKDASKNTFFDHEEMLDDRYFGSSRFLSAGDYEGSYVIRPTHAGSYAVPPSKVFEFYTPEVFGRTEGKRVGVK